MKSKFEPDLDSALGLPPAVRLIDPDAYDASEQRFAASVEEKPSSRRFVVDVAQESAKNSAGGGSPQADGDEDTGTHSTIDPGTDANLSTVVPAHSLQTELPGSQDPDAWRSEVADRVNNYRARRRPRAPRYPSLQLKFDPPEPSWTAQSAAGQLEAPTASSRLAVAMRERAVQEEQFVQPETEAADVLEHTEGGARILEFPRSAASPPPIFDELAEPVMDRPRILDVPDLLLPPPALGGILMEPVEEPEIERRPGFELPLQAAPMSKRLLAGGTDSLLVLSAFAVFACVFFKITSIVPALPQTLGISSCLIALFWSAYQYLLLVYCGTTPGLKLARLQLNRFDGTAVPTKTRRWRALASMLSGLSLALGYAWCFLDEDRLCWHDRITRTYMAPTNRVGAGQSLS
jgi:uncharacterized RDD family membrane protein YckC